MSELIPGKWLSEGFDKFVTDDPNLAEAYDLPAYPGDMTGDGNWTILYYDGDTPVGLLWNAMPDSVGIEPVIGCNTDLLTVENLRLRLHQLAGMSASEAYQEIVGRYSNASEEQTGDLDEVKRMYVSV